MKFYKDTKLGKVFSLPEGGVPRDPKNTVELTREQYNEAKDKEGEAYTIGVTQKRIFASVSQETFKAFVARCKKEHVELDAGFAGLVLAYANGADILIHKHPVPKAKEVFSYSKAVAADRSPPK